MELRKWKGSAPRRSASSNIRTRLKVPPGWIADNWSGYAIKAKKNSFHHISGYWVVPRVRSSKTNKYSSAWIGIDGFENPFLIQTGTQHDYKDGKPVYYPWWEVLPAPETRIPHPVSPGDLMYAKISKLRKNKWLILLRNKTKGWTFKKVVTYTGPASTAEWIMEATAINGKTARLANYGRMPFYKCRVNNKNPLLKRKYRGIMIQNGRVVSTPSLPNKTKDSFSIAYSSRIPLPPKSRCRKH